MFFDKLKNLIYRKSPPATQADQQLQESKGAPKEFNEKSTKETEAKLNYEKVIKAYELIIPSYSGVKMFCYYKANQQLVSTTYDIGNHMRFQLFCPVLQAQEIDQNAPAIRPLVELIVTINYDQIRFDALNTNTRYKQDFGVELLVLAFAELRIKKTKLISGLIRIPEGEEKPMSDFFRLQGIEIIVEGNNLVIVESPFSS